MQIGSIAIMGGEMCFTWSSGVKDYEQNLSVFALNPIKRTSLYRILSNKNDSDSGTTHGKKYSVCSIFEGDNGNMGAMSQVAGVDFPV